MSREHHVDDVVAGGGEAEPSVAGWAGGAGELQPGLQRTCNAKCDAAGIRARGQRPHKTTGTAATIQVAADPSKRASVTETGPRHDAAQEKARRGPGWPGGRKESGGDRNRTTAVSLGKSKGRFQV